MSCHRVLVGIKNKKRSRPKPKAFLKTRKWTEEWDPFKAFVSLLAMKMSFPVPDQKYAKEKPDWAATLPALVAQTGKREDVFVPFLLVSNKEEKREKPPLAFY